MELKEKTIALEHKFATKITESNLKDLISGKILAIWCRGYIEKKVCDMSIDRIISAVEKDTYTLTSDLQSLGTSIGEAHESIENENEYFATATQTTQLIRNVIFSHTLSPIDKLRLELDEIWTGGATLGKYNSKPMLAATIRRWKGEGSANPHIDQTEIKLLKDLDLKVRIGANLYVRTPDDNCGGGLEFWEKKYTAQEYDKLKRSDYGLDRDLVGPPDMVIHPDDGDLILFNAGVLHGVEKLIKGNRVTTACFLGYSSEDKPLRIFA